MGTFRFDFGSSMCALEIRYMMVLPPTCKLLSMAIAVYSHVCVTCKARFTLSVP